MKKLLLLSLLLIPNLILSQSWVYNTTGNPIDGEFKYAYVEGRGGKFPYNDVKLFFNKVMKSRTYNLYISGAGYFIEDYSEVKVYFENDFFSFKKNFLQNRGMDYQKVLNIDVKSLI